MRNTIIGCLIVVVIVLIGGLLFIACRARQETAAPTAQPVAASQPTIKITWPPNGARVKVGQAFQVHALATDPRGIVSIEIAVDGQPGTPGTASPPITTFSTAMPITLQTKGIHTIAVRANSTTGAKSEVASIKVVAVQNLSDPPAAGDPPTPVPQVPSSPVSAPSASQPAQPPAAPPADQPAQPPAPAGASVNFVANPTSIQSGQCSMLRWDVEGVREVYFEGVGVTGHEERQQCPTQTTTYTLRVVFTDGSARNYTATVAVSAAGVGQQGQAPPAPTGCRAQALSSTAVRIDWQYTGHSTFFVYQGRTTRVQNVAADLRSVEVSNLSPNTSYHFDVRAYNAFGESPADACAVDVKTQPASGGQAPPAPRNCRGSPSGTGVYLGWDEPLSPIPGSRTWDGYRVYQRGVSQPIKTFTDRTTVAGPVENLTPNTTYHLDVRAYNAFGESPADACAVDVKTNPASGGQAPPAAPSNLRQAAVAPVGKVNLEWKDNSNNEDGFDIERVAADGAATRIATANANATGASVDAPPCGTTYQFQVSARNSAGYSAASNKVSVTGTCPSGGVPAQPANFRVHSVTATAINLVWDDRATNETRFEVLQTGKSAPVAQTNANDTTAQILNPPCGQTLEFRVRACNAQGCSDLSNAASATTPACPPKPLVVTGVKVTITPENYSGPCPYKVNYSGTISASAAGTVKYLWILDGTAHSVRELHFDSAGTKSVEVGTWTVNAGTHTAQLKVTEPTETWAEDKIGVFCSK